MTQTLIVVDITPAVRQFSHESCLENTHAKLSISSLLRCSSNALLRSVIDFFISSFPWKLLLIVTLIYQLSVYPIFTELY